MIFEVNAFYEKIELVIKEILLKEGINSEYEIEILPPPTTGPVSYTTSIIISVEVSDKNQDPAKKILNLIVKCLKKNEACSKACSENLLQMFRQELHMYASVFPAYEKLQVENNLMPLQIYPRFYCTFDETILMENIKSNGFRHTEEIIIDNDHLKLAIMECGRFHAVSFALKEKQTKTFEDIAQRNHFYFEIYQTFYKEQVYNLFRNSLSILDSNTDMTAIDRFGSCVADVDLFFEELKSYLDDKYSIIIHGDLKSPNMMFKYEDPKEPTKPTQVCFFDFQAAAVGPPVIDLVTLLYSNFTEEKYEALDQYLNLYYQSLSTHLEKFNCDCSKLYPFEVLKAQWKSFAMFGLITTQFIAQQESLEKSKVLKLQADNVELSSDAESLSHYDFSFSSHSKGKNEIYKAIVRPLILHLVKNNFI